MVIAYTLYTGAWVLKLAIKIVKVLSWRLANHSLTLLVTKQCGAGASAGAEKHGGQ